MPALPDSAANSFGQFLGSATSGSTANAPIRVNASAPDLVALAVLMWNGGVDATGATFGVNFGGSAMSAVGSLLPMGSTTHYVMRGFVLLAPPTGPHNVVGSFSGMGTEAVTRQLKLVVATYSGVAAVSDPTAAATGSSTVNNSVTVASGLNADRVVSAHGCAGLINRFTAYNQTLRARQPSALDLAGELLLGDGEGAASVTATATQKSASVNWGAIGWTLTPSVVVGDALMKLSPLVMRPMGSILRVASPPPSRFYEIPPPPDITPS